MNASPADIHPSSHQRCADGVLVHSNCLHFQKGVNVIQHTQCSNSIERRIRQKRQRIAPLAGMAAINIVGMRAFGAI